MVIEMLAVGQRERLTQAQVLKFFDEHLDYRYLGDWNDRNGNRNIEKDLLRDWLGRQGHEEHVINRALRDLDQAAAISGIKKTCRHNQFFGVRVSSSAGYGGSCVEAAC